MFWSDEVRGVLGVGRREGRPLHARGMRTSSRPLRASRRSRCGTPRCSRRAHGRRGSSRASTGSRRCSGSPCLAPATLEAVAQAAAEALGGSSAAVLVPLQRPARGGRRIRASGGPSRDPRRARLGRREPALPRRRRGPHLVSSSICGRRAAAPRPARRRCREPLSVAHLACRWTRRATPAAGSSSSSSPRSARSATTTSSSRAISPTRRAARSSAASCSRPSAAPARSRSS